MSEDPQDADASAAEHTRRAGLRDVVAGAALLGLGALLGGASWSSGADGADVAFDVLGVGWIVWGLARLARGPATSPDRSGRTPRPRS